MSTAGGPYATCTSTTRLLTCYLLLLLPPLAMSDAAYDAAHPQHNMRKAIKQILPAAPKHWVGDGFHVHPVFGNKAFTAELSPFLMFDYAAPKYFGPSGKRRGVGQHPHRGFETVTLAFQGEIEHADSTGQSDTIHAGDVQWMTAGRGIIHEEFMSTKFSQVIREPPRRGCYGF